MRLLPDICLYLDNAYPRIKISMQPPYTIDGDIITNISQLDDERIRLNNTIIVKDYLKRRFDINYTVYLNQHNNVNTYEEYDGIIKSLRYEDFDGYIIDICRQCADINLSRAYYETQCLILESRRRVINIESSPTPLFTMHFNDDGTVSRLENTTSEFYASSRGQRSQISFNDIESDISNIIYDTVSSADFLRNNKNYIHEYNYVPNFVYHYMPDEKKSSTMLLGVEIEVGGNKNTDLNKNDVVKKCIQIMNDSESTEENFIYSTHDSTVQIELDTMPCSLEYHKQKMRYKELFKYLDSIGYKGHDCDSAGLHIHVNRSYLGSTPLLQQLTISKILYILEKFNQHICMIARRDNEYSKFIGGKENEESVVELYNKYKVYGKRSALNLRHSDTIEFRMFKSTLKYETFIVTLEFVKDIVDYAKSINVEDIEGIKWKDLFNTFSIELKSYYNSRLRKIKNKNIDNNIEELKKKISYLKKQLNHYTSYMETKRIRNELSNAEKELAKYKNKIRKENKKKESNRNVMSLESSGALSSDLNINTQSVTATSGNLTITSGNLNVSSISACNMYGNNLNNISLSDEFQSTWHVGNLT